MGMTTVEKILANHSTQKVVKPGDVVVVNVDVAVFFDSMRQDVLRVFDPDKLVWEYTLGMEQFPEHGAREPRLMSAAPEDYDVWECRPKPGFGGSGMVVTHDPPIMRIA